MLCYREFKKVYKKRKKHEAKKLYSQWREHICEELQRLPEDVIDKYETYADYAQQVFSEEVSDVKNFSAIIFSFPFSTMTAVVIFMMDSAGKSVIPFNVSNDIEQYLVIACIAILAVDCMIRWYATRDITEQLYWQEIYKIIQDLK